MDIQITRAKALKPKPDPASLGFGKHFTDHMFLLDFEPAQGWHNGRIVPYGPLPLDPSTSALHYGQLVFEGLKAYRTPTGEVVLFRPDENCRRLGQSCERMGMPRVAPQDVLAALEALLEVEKDWVPEGEGTSLYIRPFVIATDAALGVHPSDRYLLVIILSPVGAYYANGMAPTKIFVEDDYVRAVRGGSGYAKCAGNYGGALLPQTRAASQGFQQVLWLDGIERKYIEEVGAANVFFVVDGQVLTPELNGSILPGITRKSVLELLRFWDVPVQERAIPIAEIMQAGAAGKLQEAFATGTAVVISPIGELHYAGTSLVINDNLIGNLTRKIYEQITGIQYGRIRDEFAWLHRLG